MDVLGMLPVLFALNLSTGNLYPEVAVIAFHFHWSQAECLAMSAKERRRWIDEIGRINKAIAKSMRT